MILKVKIKPSKLKATNKEALINSISKMYGTLSPAYDNNLYNVLVSKDCEFCVAYSIQKFNKKVSQTKVIKKNNQKVTLSTIIREKHYIAHIYKFDMELIYSANINLIQHQNHFEIINK